MIQLNNKYVIYCKDSKKGYGNSTGFVDIDENYPTIEAFLENLNEDCYDCVVFDSREQVESMLEADPLIQTYIGDGCSYRIAKIKIRADVEFL